MTEDSEECIALQMKANPTHYSLPASMRGSDALDTVLIDRVLMPSVSTLQSHGLVRTHTAAAVASYYRPVTRYHTQMPWVAC